MRVEVSEAALVHELATALERCEYTVTRTGSHSLAVELGEALEGAARIPGAVELELDLYLKVWEAKHPGTRATRMKDGVVT